MKKLFKSLQRSYVPTSVYKKKDFSSVFLDIESPVTKGRVVIKLFEDEHPEATENFLKMCQGFENKNGKKVSFQGKKFVNHMPGYFLETEEIKETVFGAPILNENYNVQFDRPGLVGLSSDTGNFMEESTSGFFITLRDMPNLDKHVAIGEVIEGLDVFNKINENIDGLVIKNCGFAGIVKAHEENHGHVHH